MCAQFTLKISKKDLYDFYGIEVASDFVFDKKILPYQNSLVILNKNSKFELREMSFSLVPSWSKEPKAKFATHNARVETLNEKPTWKNVLRSKRCLIPISSFIEPIYENEMAGNMVSFHNPNHTLLTAAGLYDEWVNKETGQVIESFSIITSEPPDFVSKVGHDRCPIFLHKKDFNFWMDPKNNDGLALSNFLLQQKIIPDLTVQIDRPLKRGWEKRV